MFVCEQASKQVSDKSKIIEATEVGLRGAPHVFLIWSIDIRAGVLELIVACGLKKNNRRDDLKGKQGKGGEFLASATGVKCVLKCDSFNVSKK